MTPYIRLSALLLIGCTSPGTSEPASWEPLITKSWTLAPNSERTSDLQIDNIERDIYVAGLRPLSPPGTHHALLGRGVDFESGNYVFASAIGTNEIVFPEGVGLHLTPGLLLALQLHLFNATGEPMSGTSGVEYLPLDPSDLVHEVDMFLPGPKQFELPPGPSKVTSTCTVRENQTLIALFPHMHQLGTHLKTTVTHGGVATTIHDDTFDFNMQTVYPLQPIDLVPGDTITTECSWVNTGSSVVMYGESSTTEMCYSIAYRYPTRPESYCTQ